jgi:hypothetical protein
MCCGTSWRESNLGCPVCSCRWKHLFVGRGRRPVDTTKSVARATTKAAAAARALLPGCLRPAHCRVLFRAAMIALPRDQRTAVVRSLPLVTLRKPYNVVLIAATRASPIHRIKAQQRRGTDHPIADHAWKVRRARSKLTTSIRTDQNARGRKDVGLVVATRLRYFNRLGSSHPTALTSTSR